jgi:hypothetical protein
VVGGGLNGVHAHELLAITSSVRDTVTECVPAEKVSLPPQHPQHVQFEVMAPSLATNDPFLYDSAITSIP